MPPDLNFFLITIFSVPLIYFGTQLVLIIWGEDIMRWEANRTAMRSKIAEERARLLSAISEIEEERRKRCQP